jgi:hypothetical protein
MTTVETLKYMQNSSLANSGFRRSYIHMQNLRWAMNTRVDFAANHYTVPALRLTAALVCEVLVMAARLLFGCMWVPDAAIDSLQYRVPASWLSDPSLACATLPHLFSNESFD